MEETMADLQSDMLRRDNVPLLFDLSHADHVQVETAFSELAGGMVDADEPELQSQEYSIDDLLQLLDYSVDDCLSLTRTTLRKYSYENRFYFVSTFLHREELIPDVQYETLSQIDHEKLDRYMQVIRDRYFPASGQTKDLVDMYDRYGNSAWTYVGALLNSFKYPLELCPAAMQRYWMCAVDHHTNARKPVAIEKELIENRAKIDR